MAEKKAKVVPVETADQKPVRKEIQNGAAVCGYCKMPLVDFSGRIKCRFCWYCGKPVNWR